MGQLAVTANFEAELASILAGLLGLSSERSLWGLITEMAMGPKCC